jgi:hypothetical protein
VERRRQHLYYYIVFAFLAGFSERFAQDMLPGPAVQGVTGRRRRRESAEEEPDPQSG